MTNSSKQITIVGAFVIAAVAILIGLILSMGGNKWARDTIEYRVYFPTTVKGLKIGAPVMFRGISIGEVKQINLAPTNSEVIPNFENFDRDALPVEVLINVFPEQLGYYSKNLFNFLPHDNENCQKADEFLGELILEENLRAKLGTLSILTGQIYISLDFVKTLELEPEGAAKQLWARKIIPSQLSALDLMSKKMTSSGLANRLDSLQILTQSLCEFIDNGGHQKIIEDFTNITHNVAVTTDTVNTALPQLLEQIHAVSENLQQTIVKVNAILDAVQEDLPDTVTRTKDLVGNVNDLIQDTRPDIQQLIAEVNATVQTVKTELEETRVIIANLQNASAQDSPERQRVQDIMRECDQLMVQMRELLETLNHNPQALILGR